ncbi:secreted frizzled-related protein 2-like, partial [Clarias magur]
MDSRGPLVLALLLLGISGTSPDVVFDAVTSDGVSGALVSVEPGSSSSSARSVCRPVPGAMTLCRGLGYAHMRLPTLLGHESAREAQQQSGAWLALVHKRCHRDTTRFLCTLFAPACLPELPAPVRPCRGLCESVRSACAPVMNAFGFPWPEAFNCSRFPARNSSLCVPGSDDTSGDRAGPTDVIQGFVSFLFLHTSGLTLVTSLPALS